MMFLLAAVSLGFIGSFHCIGMCGPIALSIPLKTTSTASMIKGSLLYNFGRILTYSLFGLVFGLAGQGLVLAGWQNGLSVFLGITILLLVFIPGISFFSLNRGPVFNFLAKIKTRLGKLFAIQSNRSLLLIGLLNGLLPCGLVYLGIAGSIATGNAFKGVLFMAAFGFGTLPAMLTLNLVKNRISTLFRTRVRKAVPLFAGIMGLLLILRGMNLNIPYISPSVETVNGKVIHQCCHK